MPSGVVADLSISKHASSVNGISGSPHITLNGMGVNGHMISSATGANDVSPTNNSGSVTSNGTGQSGGGGKGGKGIRNRVFCGECPGCLQNDDCGKCRYCKDKTKFGGQNRLRQKCLHRRCQMDTHRKRNSTNNNNNGGAGAAGAGQVPSQVSALVAAATAAANGGGDKTASSSSSAASLYSGVDLARLAAASQHQHQLTINAAAAAAAAAAQASLDQQQTLENGDLSTVPAASGINPSNKITTHLQQQPLTTLDHGASISSIKNVTVSKGQSETPTQLGKIRLAVCNVLHLIFLCNW